MILHLLTALAAAASAPSSGRCPDVLNVEALICRATDAGHRGAFRESAEGFERAAETKRATGAAANDAEIDRLMAAAGNMWIAAGDPAKAAAALDKALAGTGLAAEHRGEALLDRARAAEAAGDLKTARARVNEAMGTIAKDPFAWYFSAALAIREGNPKDAERMIGEALALAPADPTILFEAGHVAEAMAIPAPDLLAAAIELDPEARRDEPRARPWRCFRCR